jgi:hypothetical protein
MEHMEYLQKPENAKLAEVLAKQIADATEKNRVEAAKRERAEAVEKERAEAVNQKEHVDAFVTNDLNKDELEQVEAFGPLRTCELEIRKLDLADFNRLVGYQGEGDPCEELEMSPCKELKNTCEWYPGSWSLFNWKSAKCQRKSKSCLDENVQWDNEPSTESDVPSEPELEQKPKPSKRPVGLGQALGKSTDLISNADALDPRYYNNSRTRTLWTPHRVPNALTTREQLEESNSPY